MIHFGLDVGRYTDRTALVGIDGAVVNEAHVLPGLPFREQADVLVPLLSRDCLCLVDVTGLGVGLFEILRDRGLPVVPVTLGSTALPKIMHEGDRSRVRGVYVGKTYLIGRMLGLVNARALTVAPWCCNRDELRSELGELTIGYTRKGGLTTSARRGHDDLALALSLAILARTLSSRLLRSATHGPEVQAA